MSIPRVSTVFLLCVVGWPAACFTAFWAAVLWTGCFMSCEEPNRLGGAGFGALTAALLLVGPVAAWVSYRSWKAVALGVLCGALAVGTWFLQLGS